MAVQTTTITGLVLAPSGSPVTGGRIRARLTGPGTVDDAGTNQKIHGFAEFAIGANGAVNFALVPNDVISPAGSIYSVEFNMPDGASWVEFWSLATAPDPIEIGDITRVNP